MILQALKEYYDRKAADPDSDIAPEGFEKKAIPFIIVIKRDGTFLNLKSTRENVGGKYTSKTFLLPRSEIRTGTGSFEKTFLLWDHIGYLFGWPKGDPKATKQHETWLNSLKALPADLKRDEGVKAILLFYERGEAAKVQRHASWSECLRLPSCNMTFSLAGEDDPVPCRMAVRNYQRALIKSRDLSGKKGTENGEMLGRCLITGEYGEIAKIHGRTPINKDTKSLVAIQMNSGYDSYGKEQGYNAPVCKRAEFCYTTGLNTLLKSKGQRIRVGDATVVFWSEKRSSLETDVFFFFSAPPRDDPDRNTEAVKALYNSIWNGTYVVPDDSTRFYVLGLAPNAARIAVRFWNFGTVREMGTRLKQHVEDLAIVHSLRLDSALPIQKLLRSIAAQGEDDYIPPNIAGEMMRSILGGTPYPISLLQAAVRRARAEQSKKNKKTGKAVSNVSYERAALIKACLNRALRFNNPNKEREINMCLDPENTNIGYRLGRLFAVLEKIQTEANLGINATIRDRFYGSASCSPVTVFGNLMRLSNHHLSKLQKEKLGLFISRRQLIGEIMYSVTDFPANLSLADQGRFAIGYYHQTQALWTSRTVKP
ncbi:MAG: type I-C CRISPR-associated protein Cas8c/Csd1 [Syntrophales bacterium]|nr:type I-C CRISPR-associated protein Cas8c/Csd1 [Syntrophales bacterium]